MGMVLRPLIHIIYINNLDIKGMIIKFAKGNDGAVISEESSFENDLDQLVKWAELQQIEFCPDKCKVMHLKINKSLYLGMVGVNECLQVEEFLKVTNR